MLWLVLLEALVLVVIGLIVGVLALLYELRPNDPLTIAMATIVLMMVALVAGYLPARA